MLLRLEKVNSGYRTGEVLHGISLAVEKGEMVSLIGPNGAGKSTILRTISGLLACKKGNKFFEERNITHFPAHKTSRAGIAQVPEGRQILAPLTVYQNLLLGCYPRYSSLGSEGRLRLLDSVYKIFPILAERQNQLGGTLSGGEQQMLAIGRALMAEPKLLLMDEPSLGLAPLVVEQIFAVLGNLSSQGLTILLAEQNAVAALGLTNRAYLVEQGEIVLEGESRTLRQDDRVKQVYLGGVKLN